MIVKLSDKNYSPLNFAVNYLGLPSISDAVNTKGSARSALQKPKKASNKQIIKSRTALSEAFMVTIQDEVINSNN